MCKLKLDKDRGKWGFLALQAGRGSREREIAAIDVLWASREYKEREVPVRGQGQGLGSGVITFEYVFSVGAVFRSV